MDVGLTGFRPVTYRQGILACIRMEMIPGWYRHGDTIWISRMPNIFPSLLQISAIQTVLFCGWR
jgi:hypothetical protein